MSSILRTLSRRTNPKGFLSMPKAPIVPDASRCHAPTDFQKTTAIRTPFNLRSEGGPVFKFRFVACVALALGTLTASVAMADKDPAASEVARQHFKAGIAYVEDPSGPKYEEALQEFRRAYAESPLPKIMNNIGLCALHLERDGEAIEAYEIYLKGNSADLTASVRKQVEKDVAMLKASLVKVSVSGEPKSLSLVDERRNSSGALVVNRYKLKDGVAALGLHPGHHKVTASATGYETAEWEFDAEPGSSLEHAFALQAVKSASSPVTTESKPAPAQPISASEPPKEPAAGLHTGFYVGAVSAGVFAAAATVTGVLALGKDKDFKSAQDAGNAAEADRLSTSGKRLALITDIGIGAAVVSAGVATYFYFTSPSKPAEKVASPVGLRLAPTVGTERAGLQLSGSF